MPKNMIKEKHEMQEAVCDIISRIFYHGNFKIETPNERTVAGLLKDLGLFPTSEEEIIKRPDHEEYFQKYKEYRLDKT